MKKLFIRSALLSSIFFISCNGGNSTATSTGKDSADTKEVAKDQNEQKFDNTDMEKDADFAVKIADAGRLEVDLGKLAETNAAAAGVKDYAKMMIEDHGKSNAELAATAKQKNITLPAGLSDKCQKKYDELSALHGKEFDKKYMDAMVDGHQDVLDELKKEAEKGKDGDIRAWAQGKIDVVQHHLEVAKSTKNALK